MIMKIDFSLECYDCKFNFFTLRVYVTIYRVYVTFYQNYVKIIKFITQFINVMKHFLKQTNYTVKDLYILFSQRKKIFLESEEWRIVKSSYKSYMQNYTYSL